MKIIERKKIGLISRALMIIAISLLSTGSFGQANDSLDIKIGQMILIGFPGPELDRDVLKEVAEGKVG